MGDSLRNLLTSLPVPCCHPNSHPIGQPGNNSLKVLLLSIESFLVSGLEIIISPLCSSHWICILFQSFVSSIPVFPGFILPGPCLLLPGICWLLQLKHLLWTATYFLTIVPPPEWSSGPRFLPWFLPQLPNASLPHASSSSDPFSAQEFSF